MSELSGGKQYTFKLGNGEVFEIIIPEVLYYYIKLKK